MTMGSSQRLWPTIWRTYRMGWAYPWRFVAMLCLTLAIALLSGFAFWVLREVMEQMGAVQEALDAVRSDAVMAGQVLEQAVARMVRFGTWVIPLAVPAAVLAWSSWYMGQWLANRSMQDVRERFLTHLIDLEVAFHGRLAKGDLINRMSADMTTMQTLIQLLFSKLFQRSLEIAGVLIWLFIIDWRLSLWMLPLLGLVAAVLVMQFGRTRRRSRRARQSLADNLVMLEQITSGIRVIKAMGSGRREAERYDEANGRLFGATMKVARARANADAVSHGLVFLLTGLVLILGAKLFARQAITPPVLVVFLTALGRLATLARTTQRAWGEVYEHTPAAERIYAILDRPGRIVDRPGAATAGPPRDAIRFERVTFRYADDAEPVLERFDLEIPVGRSVALVGESGAGKSTLLDLLPRFHDVQEGRITIDGIDLRDLTHDSLTRLYGVVQQDSFLFNDTIYNNIAYGRPGATRAEVEEAARRAHVHQAILALEGGQGYETVVGDRGERLSGGQRQRVAIARALLRDAAVLLLDEPTSALDAESERHVQEALDELMKGRTSVIVAHRLATVQRADVIHVLSKAEHRIIESGSHAELMAQGGEYARLVALQQLSG